MQPTSESTPVITVISDYDNAFTDRVEAAIKLAAEQGKLIVYKEIKITSGPFRPYCLAYKKEAPAITLYFYSAARVFGFQHTIQDIADLLTGSATF